MNSFAKFIARIIVGYLKRAWYYFKVNALKDKLEKEKPEAENAIAKANDDYFDFNTLYSEYKSSRGGRGESSVEQQKSELRHGTEEVRGDSGESKKGS